MPPFLCVLGPSPTTNFIEGIYAQGDIGAKQTHAQWKKLIQEKPWISSINYQCQPQSTFKMDH